MGKTGQYIFIQAGKAKDSTWWQEKNLLSTPSKMVVVLQLPVDGKHNNISRNLNLWRQFVPKALSASQRTRVIPATASPSCSPAGVTGLIRASLKSHFHMWWFHKDTLAIFILPPLPSCAFTAIPQMCNIPFTVCAFTKHDGISYWVSFFCFVVQSATSP